MRSSARVSCHWIFAEGKKRKKKKKVSHAETEMGAWIPFPQGLSLLLQIPRVWVEAVSQDERQQSLPLRNTHDFIFLWIWNICGAATIGGTTVENPPDTLLVVRRPCESQQKRMMKLWLLCSKNGGKRRTERKNTRVLTHDQGIERLLFQACRNQAVAEQKNKKKGLGLGLGLGLWLG